MNEQIIVEDSDEIEIIGGISSDNSSQKEPVRIVR